MSETPDKVSAQPTQPLTKRKSAGAAKPKANVKAKARARRRQTLQKLQEEESEARVLGLRSQGYWEPSLTVVSPKTTPSCRCSLKMKELHVETRPDAGVPGKKTYEAGCGSMEGEVCFVGPG